MDDNEQTAEATLPVKAAAPESSGAEGGHAMTLEDCYGLLFLAYFALVFSAGVGAFARGATGFAVLIVVLLAGPFIGLLVTAIAAVSAEDDPA